MTLRKRYTSWDYIHNEIMKVCENIAKDRDGYKWWKFIDTEWEADGIGIYPYYEFEHIPLTEVVQKGTASKVEWIVKN